MKQNKDFPIVTLKMAQTLDGKTATAKGQSKWITSARARAFVQQLRAGHDAVLVGTRTVLKDDPRLDVRGKVPKSKNRCGWRVILDPRAQVKADAKVFKGSQKTIRVVEKRVAARKLSGRNLRKKAEILLPVKTDARGRLQLKELMKNLKALGIEKILVEGGSETAWSFLKEGLVSRIYWLIAPKILGGRDALGSVGGTGIKSLEDSIKVKKLKVRQLGPDFLFEGVL